MAENFCIRMTKEENEQILKDIENNKLAHRCIQKCENTNGKSEPEYHENQKFEPFFRIEETNGGLEFLDNELVKK